MSLVTSQTSKWTSHLDDSGSGSMFEQRREHALGKAFASTVSRLSTPASRANFERKQTAKKKDVSGLKLYFLEDPQFTSGVIEIDDNPTFDSHYRIVDDLWAKPGKKLSDEARLISDFDRDLIKEQLDSKVDLLTKLKKNYIGNTLGPLKREEYPEMKKPDKVFGRHREVNSFLRAKVFARPKKHWQRVNPEIVIQPDLYPHRDIWQDGNGSGTYGLHGSASFVSGSARFQGLEVDNTLIDRDTEESILNTSIESPSRLKSASKATLDIRSPQSRFDSSTGLFLSDMNASVTNIHNLSYNAHLPYDHHPIFKYPISSPIQYKIEKEWPREIRYAPDADLMLKDLAQNSIINSLASKTNNNTSMKRTDSPATINGGINNNSINDNNNNSKLATKVVNSNKSEEEIKIIDDDLSVSSLASSQRNESVDSQSQYKDYVKSFVAMHLEKNKTVLGMSRGGSSRGSRHIFITDDATTNIDELGNPIRPISRGGPIDDIKLEPLIQKLLSPKTPQAPCNFGDFEKRGGIGEGFNGLTDRDNDIPYDSDEIDRNGNVLLKHISNDAIPSSSSGSRPITAPFFTPPVIHSKSYMRKKFEARVLTTTIPTIINDLPENSKGILTNTADLIPVNIELNTDQSFTARQRALYAPKPKSQEGKLASSQSESVLESFKMRHKALSESSLLVKKSSSTLINNSRPDIPGSAHPQRGGGDLLGASRRQQSIKKLAPGEISRASEIILDAIATNL